MHFLALMSFLARAAPAVARAAFAAAPKTAPAAAAKHVPSSIPAREKEPGPRREKKESEGGMFVWLRSCFVVC